MSDKTPRELLRDSLERNARDLAELPQWVRNAMSIGNIFAAAEPPAEPAPEPECPGAGECHGCMKWCATCGDAAAHVCPHRENGCSCHPSEAVLRAEAFSTSQAVWDADSDLVEMHRKVAALRAQLTPLERELAVRTRGLQAAWAEYEEANERLAGFEAHARKAVYP